MLSILQNLTNYFSEESLTVTVIVLTLLNIVLMLLLAYVYISSREDRARLERKVKQYDHLLLLLRAYCLELEKDGETKSIKISNIDRRLLSCETDIRHMELSINRFAPPLDKDKDYESITWSGKIQ